MALRHHGKQRWRVVAAVFAPLVAALSVLTSAAFAAPSSTGGLSPQLAEVRRATSKYHNLNAALADGYVVFGEGHCVEAPGLGGMGFHYYHPSLLFDGVLEPTQPELLVYAPSGNGVRLVAVEYMMPLSTWSGPDAPDLFGKPFDGPMAEHDPNTSGPHYDQHAWVWSHNPDGVLATWNPSVEC